jgi:hypothetical protein
MPEMFGLASRRTELEIALEEYRGALGDTPGTRLLARVTEADDAYGDKKYSPEEKVGRLADVEQWARWESDVEEEELRRLLGVVASVSEASYENGYVLARVLLAAAVRHAGLDFRLNAALVCGNSAMSFGQIETAKVASADAIESLRLARRYLPSIYKLDTERLAEVESAVLRSGKSAEETEWAPLDLPETHAADRLIESAIWHTDDFKGFTSRADAAARMAIRLEHWIEVQGGDAEAIAGAFEGYIDSDSLFKNKRVEPGSGDAVRARFAAMCADALLETGNGGAAARLYDRALGYLDGGDQYRSRISIGQAAALFAAGTTDRAREVLSAINFSTLGQLGELVLTWQGEVARYLAVARVLHVPCADERDPITIARDVASVLVGSAPGRMGYQRELYCGQLMREIESFAEWAK